MILLTMIDVNKRNGQQNDYLLDEFLYKCRFVIQRTNAWVDGLKAILIRFETNKIHWRVLNLLVFCFVLLKQL